MKNEFKTGDTVIWDFDSSDYYFIGMSNSELNVNNYGKTLNCVIERNCVVTYANKEDLKLKPETVQHPGGEMPKPLSMEEADDAYCIYVAQFYSKGVHALCVRNDTEKHNYGFIGHAYSTEDEALSAAHIMFNIPKGE